MKIENDKRHGLNSNFVNKLIVYHFTINDEICAARQEYRISIFSR